MDNQPKQNGDRKPRIERSKILRVVASAVIAFCIWFYVISVERTETEQRFSNVQVEFEGASALEDRGLKVISDTDMEVDITLNGRRSVLNSLRSSDLTVRVDLTRIYEAGTRGLSYDIIYPGDVSGSDIEVVSRKPDTIEVTVVSWAEKRVNVKPPVITGEPAEGFRLGTIASEDWSPKTVKVAGPKEVIERIEYAALVLDIEGINESKEIRKSFVYYDSYGNLIEDAADVQSTPPQGEITIPVLMEREVEMRLPLAIDRSRLDTEYTITATVTLTDGTKKNIVGVLFNSAEGLESNDLVFEGLTGDQPYMKLGSVLAYGPLKSMDMCSLAQLPEFSPSDVQRKEFSAQDFDIYQDGNNCDVQSVVVTVSARMMETGEYEVTIQNESGFQFTVSRPEGGLKVLLKGFEEDLARITEGEIVVRIPEGTKVGDSVELEVILSDRLKALGITVVYVPTVKAESNVSFTGNVGQGQI